MDNQRMEKIISLAKRRGFIFPGSEIYGGLAGTWDYGHYGVALKENIKNVWWQMFVKGREDMYGVDAAIIMNPKAWEASGHVSGFSDPLVECEKCKRRFRADQLDNVQVCPECGGKLGTERQFNMMFQTQIGAMQDSASTVYLRPETAGGIFVNFKNIVDTFHPDIPFGIAQIGKAFRNEITPRDFIFRVREMEQMEIEYFVRSEEWERSFEEWRKAVWSYINAVGIERSLVSELDVAEKDRAHYSMRTIDFEFEFPFGKKELYGLAYRTDFDLSAHAKASGAELSFYEEATKERFVPHVVEPSFGVERTILAVLVSAYREDELGGETRTYLQFHPRVAPVKAAVFPLLKNKPELVARAREVFAELKQVVPDVMFDDNGNIGKRYRRQDEIGTPFCVTVDFDTIEKDQAVTLRSRDTGTQERLSVSEAVQRIKEAVG